MPDKLFVEWYYDDPYGSKEEAKERKTGEVVGNCTINHGAHFIICKKDGSFDVINILNCKRIVMTWEGEKPY